MGKTLLWLGAAKSHSMASLFGWAVSIGGDHQSRDVISFWPKFAPLPRTRLYAVNLSTFDERCRRQVILKGLIMADNGNGELLRAHALIEQMTTLIARARDDSFEQMFAALDRRGRRIRNADTIPIQQYRVGTQLAEMAGELDFVLSEAGYEHTADEELVRRFEAGAPWSLGTELEVFPPRKIFRGYLVPVQEMPILVQISLQVFAFLAIEGDKDLLDRDNDQFGIHYHYVLASKERTTTMICWDTRWTSVDPTDLKGLKPRPIFHELHGEGRYTKVVT